MPPFASCVAADLCGNYKLAAKKILTSRTIRLHRVQKKVHVILLAPIKSKFIFSGFYYI